MNPDAGSFQGDISLARHVDDACDRFAAAWDSDARPQIESCLAETTASRRPVLLRELLLLEMELRRKMGETPVQDDYLERFAEYRAVVEQVFGDHPVPLAAPITTAAFQDDTPGAAGKPGPYEPIADVFGDYEILRELGRGGMGVVYLAHQRSADRTVALKVIRPERLEGVPADQRLEAVSRFRTEALAAARLQHDHLLTVFEVSEVGGRPFYSMRYVEGNSLTEMLRDGPLDARRAAALLAPIARAVEAAHQTGVLHRDLKPHNILIDRREERPLVADFGLAKLLEGGHDVTMAGQVFGSAPYMAPEQALDSRHATVASDVYSLGATLYQMLTGRPPFQAASTPETLRQVVEVEPVPPRQLNPAMHRDLETICLKCLQKEPSRRYPSAESLADDLERYLADRPILARPITPLGRAWRWTRRNPLVAALLSVLFVTMATGLVAVTTQWQRANANLKDSQEQRRLAQAAVKDLLVRVGSEDLQDIPEMEPVRKELLERALQYYGRFLRDAGNDPHLRREWAQSQSSVGEIYRLLGENEKAEQAFQTAISRQQELAAEFPGQDDYRVDIAATYCGLGNLLFREGRFEEAEEAFRADHDITERLTRRQPSKYGFNLAGTLVNLGSLYRESGNRREAMTAYEKGQGIAAELVLQDPENLKYLKVLATFQYNLGFVYRELGRNADAENALQGTLETLEREPAQEQRSRSLRRLRGQTNEQLAWLYNTTGRPAEAQECAQKALEVTERLARDHPTVPRYQFLLARVIGTTGYVARTLRQPDKAAASFQRSARMLEELCASHAEAEYAAQLGLTSVDLGWQHQVAGDADQAEQAYDQAIDLLQPIVTHQPHVPQYNEFLGRAYHELGVLYLHKADQAEKAREAYGKALPLREYLVSQAATPQYLDDLAWTYQGLLATCEQLGDPQQAFSMGQKAIETRRRLAEAWPETPEYRIGLAKTLTAVALSHFRLQQIAEAIEIQETAIAESENVVADYPDTAFFVSEFARYLATLGFLYGASDQNEAMVQQYSKGIEVLQESLERNPDDAKAADCREYLRSILSLRAQARSETLGQHEQALSDIELALESDASEKKPRRQLTRAAILVRQGDHPEGTAATEACLQRTEPDARMLCEAARIYGLAFQAISLDRSLPPAERTDVSEQYAARALGLLRQAAPQESQLVATMVADEAEFDRLRERADFRALTTPR